MASDRAAAAALVAAGADQAVDIGLSGQGQNSRGNAAQKVALIARTSGAMVLIFRKIRG